MASQPYTPDDVYEYIASARDRMQAAHRDLEGGEVADALFCVMRAINHLAVGVDILAAMHGPNAPGPGPAQRPGKAD